MNTENRYQETDLGNVSPNPRGEYTPGTEYEYLDLVTFDGGSYICVAELGTTTSISPESGKSTDFWQCMTIPGDMTPEYVAMHDRVVNLSEQVEADAEEVRTAEQNVSGMKENVTQMQKQTRQSANLAEQSKDSAAGYAASADASRQAAETSEQNINAQVTGFDAHVDEKTSESNQIIEAARIAANKAILAQQEQSVNEVARVGGTAVSEAQAAARVATEKASAASESEKNAKASETAAKLSETNATKMAEQVAADKEQVAYDRTAVENAKQEMTGSVAQIKQNTQGITELKGDLIYSSLLEEIDLDSMSNIGWINANGNYITRDDGFKHTNSPVIVMNTGDKLILNASGYSTNVAMISQWVGSLATTSAVPLVVSADGVTQYEYTATKNNVKIIACYNYKKDHSAKIIRNVESIAEEKTKQVISEAITNDYEYFQVFHKIGGVGDSLMSGEHAYNDGTNSHYVDLYSYSWLSNIARRNGVECVHYSKGGLTSKAWLESNYKSALENEELKPSVYFISLGTNEVNTGVTLGSIEDCGTDNDTFYANYYKVIQTIKTANSTAKIFCLSLYWGKSETILSFANAIKEMAETYDCYYVDLLNLATDYSVENQYINWGHFTTLGYSRVSKEIENIVNDIIRNNISDFSMLGLDNRSI